MNGFTLITGGAGFIGANYAARCLARGEKVVIFDNLSRRGAELNIEWLSDRFERRSFELVKEDVRDAAAIKTAARGADRILHLAGQVAVTTSVCDPRTDFEINAGGTFNVLEAARASGRNPVFCTLRPTRCMGDGDEQVIEQEIAWIILTTRTVSMKTKHLIFIRPMVALRELEINTPATIFEFMASQPSFSGNPASMVRASLVSKTRAGWHGSSSQRSLASRSPFMAMVNRFAMFCSLMTCWTLTMPRFLALRRAGGRSLISAAAGRIQSRCGLSSAQSWRNYSVILSRRETVNGGREISRFTSRISVKPGACWDGNRELL